MAGDPSRGISGTFGHVYIDGEWIMNIYKLTAEIEIQKEEIKLSGKRQVGHKVIATKGTGTMTGYKVSSRFVEMHKSVSGGGLPPKFDIVSRLEDPESYGVERIRLVGCMVDKVQLANWEVGTSTSEEIPFTFDDFELLDPIEEE